MRHPFFKPKNHIIWPFLAILVHIRDLPRPFLGRFASHGMQIPMKTGGDLSFNVALYQIWYEKSILKLVRPYNYQKNCRDEKWTLDSLCTISKTSTRLSRHRPYSSARTHHINHILKSTLKEETTVYQNRHFYSPVFLSVPSYFEPLWSYTIGSHRKI